MRDGYSNAAASRLRTLYEHLVTTMIVHNDHSYEVSERYQAHAVFDEVQKIRAEARAVANPIFRWPEGSAQEVAAALAEATSAANRSRAKWGLTIEERYEWARPALAKKSGQRKIAFSDLESAAGITFLRSDYLRGNERIHAGAYTTINYLELTRSGISPIRPCRDDSIIEIVGSRAATLLGWAARSAGKSIAWETEEYDELLYICEIKELLTRQRNPSSELSPILSRPPDRRRVLPWKISV